MLLRLTALILSIFLVACSGEPGTPEASGEQTAMMKPIEGGDTQAIGCRGIRNDVETLVAEYKNATEARRAEILTEIDNLGRRWNQAGRRARYGDMYALTGDDAEELGDVLKMRNTDTP